MKILLNKKKKKNRLKNWLKNTAGKKKNFIVKDV